MKNTKAKLSKNPATLLCVGVLATLCSIVMAKKYYGAPIVTKDITRKLIHVKFKNSMTLACVSDALEEYTVDVTTAKWNFEGHILSGTHIGSTTKILFYDFSPAGEVGLAATNEEVFIIDTKKKEKTKIEGVGAERSEAIALSHDGKKALVDRFLVSLNAEKRISNKIEFRKDAKRLCAKMKFSPDNSLFAIGYYDGGFEVRRSVDGHLIWQHKAPKPFPTQGLSYIVTDPIGNPANLTYYGIPGLEEFYFPIRFIGSNKLAYSNGRNVSLCSARTGSLIHSIPRFAVYDLDCTPDQKSLFVSGIQPNSRPGIEVWDIDDGTLNSELSHSGLSFNIEVSPDGKYLASLEELKVKIWTIG